MEVSFGEVLSTHLYLGCLDNTKNNPQTIIIIITVYRLVPHTTVSVKIFGALYVYVQDLVS